MNANTLPFYYSVQCRLFAYKNNDDIKVEIIVRDFDKDPDPLIERDKAFKAFEDYLSMLEVNNRLEIVNGNYKIIQHPVIKGDKISDSGERFKDTKEVSKNLPKNDKTQKEYREKEEFFSELGIHYDVFKEEISICVVVTSDEIIEDVLNIFDHEKGQPEYFTIHSTSLTFSDEQEMVDNLDWKELELYKYFKIDTKHLEKDVFHYGWDWDQNREEDGEKECSERRILTTPYIWSSLERYKKDFFNEDGVHVFNKSPKLFEDDEIDYLGIIRQGETEQIEFKTSLLYDFVKKEAKYLKKHAIAKAICGLLNTKGGVLFIGIGNKGEVKGLNVGDYLLFKDNFRDNLNIAFDNLIVEFFGVSLTPLLFPPHFIKLEGQDIYVVVVPESPRPVFLKRKHFIENEPVKFTKEFYTRLKASTHPISDVEEIIEYIFNKNWKARN